MRVAKKKQTVFCKRKHYHRIRGICASFLPDISRLNVCSLAMRRCLLPAANLRKMREYGRNFIRNAA